MEDNNIDIEIENFDENKEVEEKPKIFKKIFLIIIGVFLIILIVTYLLTNPIIRSIFVGLVESSKIKDNIVGIDFKNKLIFQNNTYDGLLNIYDNNPGLEFKVCLNGYIENGNYLINEVYIPETYLQTHNKVIAEPCPNDSLVDMHSHPLKHCLPSEQDFKSFKSFKERNDNAIMAVMCERGRFNFYS
ncbi:MAG: hypothetical protein AABX55_00705 [Nanoarchaeota archaeon]